MGIYDNFKAKFENYRKYVWNDFSIVEKARIQIISSGTAENPVTIGSCVPGEQHELKLVEDLPVQINPTELKYEHHIDTRQVLHGLQSSSNRTVNENRRLISFGGERDDGSFVIPLIFDIYDEYNARTMNGTMTKDFSLAYDKSTSLPRLIYYSNLGYFYARFLWGDMAKFGLLSGVSAEYTAFSPWGQPLKATATVYITEQHVDGNDPKNLDIGFSTSEFKNTGKKILNGLKNMFR